MIELRKHQKEAHTITRQNIEAGETRMILEMATGTGKSYTQAALLYDQAQDGDHVQAAFVPTQDLVSQNARSYRRYFEEMGKEVNIIGVFAPNEDIMREGLDTVTTSPEDILAAMDPSKANHCDWVLRLISGDRRGLCFGFEVRQHVVRRSAPDGIGER